MVTIIIICYKNIADLWMTLDSILEQNYKNIQLIISDDASEEFDLDAVREYAGKCENLVINANKSNLGTVQHLNKILQFVNGEYIKLISPGDKFVGKNSLSNMVKSIGTGNILVSPTLAYGKKIQYLNPSRQSFKRLKTNTLAALYTRNEINIIGTIFRSDLILSNGFNNNYRIIEDYPFVLQLAKDDVEFVFDDNVYCYYKLGGVSTSGGNEQFRVDLINLYENEILPFCKKRDTVFEYKKHIAMQRRKKAEIAEVVVKYADLVLKSKIEYFSNLKNKEIHYGNRTI